jgi:hypothetical protein
MTVAAARSCRICHGLLQPLLNLGDLTLPVFLAPGDPPGPRAPLDLRVCDSCALVQLADTVAPDLLYRQYWYRSSINETMRAELTSIVRAALLEVSVYPQDLVVDVGANDGYLLSQYPKERAHWAATRIAFEPARNLQDACLPACEVLIPHYFPPAAADLERMPGVAGRVKILTSIAMFYDLDEPALFVRAVDRLLADEGVWILQFQDLAQMIEATAVDNICHEHLTYWSLAAFCWFLDRCGADLHVTHVERRVINGGSLRLYVRRRVYPVDRTIDDLRQAEEASIGWLALERFAWQATEIRRQLTALVVEALNAEQVIDLYGASTKANTLLQWCRFGGRTIRQAWERNPEKIGRLTATGIPIVHEEDGRANPPDLLLAGIWQFRESLLVREAAFLAGGGAILFPLPEVDVVTRDRAQPA